MILNLLEQAGLSGRIDGEYLQGGVGELQAVGLVRVMVVESDYDTAQKIIEKWDAEQILENESAISKNTSPLNYGILGFIFGAVLVAIFYNTPVTVEGVDYNSDGQLDEKWTYIDDRVAKAEIDRNFDGNIDLLFQYDHKGLIKSSTSDENFDGVFETASEYQRGNIIWSKSDTNGDKFKDYRMSFKHGVLNKVTFVNPSTQQPLKIQKYGSIKLVSTEVDTNADGILETLYQYNDIEEIESKSITRPLD